MAGFMAGIAGVNALADTAPGFVWRLQDGDGPGATALRPCGPDIMVNMSVWENLESLRDFVYRSGAHLDFMRRRRAWFHPMAQPYLVLRWGPAGHIRGVGEALSRLGLPPRGSPRRPARHRPAASPPRAPPPRRGRAPRWLTGFPTPPPGPRPPRPPPRPHPPGGGTPCPATIGGAARWRNAGSWRWEYGILALAVRRGVDHGRVTSAHLRRRAEARGVTTAYRDWQGRRVQVRDETLQAVLAALGSSPPPARPRPGASAA